MTTRETLTALAFFADAGIGITGNEVGDAYRQGVRDLAAALSGVGPLADYVGIGNLASALEGFADCATDYSPNAKGEITPLPDESTAPDHTRYERDLAALVRRHHPTAVAFETGVSEWDNGYWYDHYGLTAVLPDGTKALVNLDDGGMDHDIAHEALTELTGRDGPLGRHDSLHVRMDREVSR